jgi:DNA anti-recombination protein RmuC
LLVAFKDNRCKTSAALHSTNFAEKIRENPDKPMNDQNASELTALIDLLSQHTAKYTAMLRTGTTQQEFDQCKTEIEKIQQEIERRKQMLSSNTNTGTPGISSADEPPSDT